LQILYQNISLNFVSSVVRKIRNGQFTGESLEAEINGRRGLRNL